MIFDDDDDNDISQWHLVTEVGSLNIYPKGVQLVDGDIGGSGVSLVRFHILFHEITKISVFTTVMTLTRCC